MVGFKGLPSCEVASTGQRYCIPRHPGDCRKKPAASFPSTTQGVNILSRSSTLFVPIAVQDCFLLPGFLYSPSLTAGSLCVVLKRSPFLHCFGMWDISVVALVKAKTDNKIFICCNWTSWGGSSVLFPLIVPTRASFHLRSFSAKVNPCAFFTL